MGEYLDVRERKREREEEEILGVRRKLCNNEYYNLLPFFVHVSLL